MLIAEQAGGLVLPVKGLVTVELADADTGRVTHRETAENFLSLQSLKVAKWWQRMMWGAFIPTETNDAAGNRPTEMPWFPAQHIGYWNDATAEAPSTEDSIVAPLVGWASRHPIGSPSGKRGVVNITESVMTDAAAKWVFDWATSQGNGTFQSVGWTRVDEVTGFLVPHFPADDALVTFAQANNLNGQNCAPLYWDPSTSLWYVTEWNGTNFIIKSAAAAGGALTTVTTLPTWTASYYEQIRGMARIGTDWITCGQGSSAGNGRLMRHTVAGVQVWTKTLATGGGIWTDCTVDGSSNIWTIDYLGVIRRHSNVDGTVTATVTPAIISGATMGYGIAYDPADGNFWVLGYFTVGTSTDQLLWKMDSSGNTIGPCLNLNRNPQTATISTTPWVGTYNVPAARPREPYQLTLWNNAALAGSNISRVSNRPNYPFFNAPPYGGNLAVKAGQPWISDKGALTNGTGANNALGVKGGTLGTRSLLAGPLTKTSAQTLKITYQFNFS